MVVGGRIVKVDPTPVDALVPRLELAYYQLGGFQLFVEVGPVSERRGRRPATRFLRRLLGSTVESETRGQQDFFIFFFFDLRVIE